MVVNKQDKVDRFGLIISMLLRQLLNNLLIKLSINSNGNLVEIINMKLFVLLGILVVGKLD